MGGLVGGGDRAQLLPGVTQYDARGVGGQQLHTEADQPIQQVNDVVLVDQRVGQVTNARLISSSPSPCDWLTADTLRRSHHYSMSSVNASRRPTTSRATSMSNRLCTNACARIRANASGAPTSSCTDTIPVA